MDNKWLIVGLGNPGPKYELTRHNFGFLAIDALLDEQRVSTTKSSFNGQVAKFDYDGQQCFTLKPETFMNRSGSSVQQAMAFHKIALSNLIVLHDELDLPFGALRVKRGGGNGGHNGLKDISRLLGADFLRIRLGIGRPAIKGTEADYVLHPFKNDELSAVSRLVKSASLATLVIIKNGLDAAQRDYQINPQK